MTVNEEAKVHVNGEYVSGKLDLMHSDRFVSVTPCSRGMVL